MFYSKRTKKQLPPNSITLNRVAIPRALSVKYLGVHLDNRLTFKQHIEKAALRADNLCRTFYPYIGRNSFATKKLKLKIYKTYIRPCLLYASPLLSRVAKSNLEILQRKQNKFLRLILNKNMYTRIKDLHEGSRLETVRDFTQKLDTNFRSKAALSNNSLINQMA